MSLVSNPVPNLQIHNCPSIQQSMAANISSYELTIAGKALTLIAAYPYRLSHDHTPQLVSAHPLTVSASQNTGGFLNPT